MVKIDSKIAQIDEKEITAYIQQQMMDLTPHLEEKSALQVRLTQLNDGFEAELTAYQPEGEIQTVGRNPSIFEAIRYAKEGLIDYMVEVEENLHPHLRDDKIELISRHGNLYLH